jgi:hypothetical protein
MFNYSYSPILRNHVCPVCKESGDFAHTYNHCPVVQKKKKTAAIQKEIQRIKSENSRC